MNKIFVIAGTYDQFKLFANQLAASMNEEGIRVNRLDLVYVSDVNQLRGCHDVWGYRVGTYADRKDINEISRQLAISGSCILDNFIEVEL